MQPTILPFPFCSLAQPDQRDAFGVIISYAVKVKLFLGALGGELSAELPFVLMHPKVKLFQLKLFCIHDKYDECSFFFPSFYNAHQTARHQG